MSTPLPPPRVFKIFRASEWEELQRDGSFTGSADDARDGFIHLSNEEQLEGTLDKHYSGAGTVIVAQVSTVGLPIKMEISRGGAHFPHLYGKLPLSAVVGHEKRQL